MVDKLGANKKHLIQKLGVAREDIDSLRKYALASDQSIADSTHQHQINMACLRKKNEVLVAEIKSTATSLARENKALLQQSKDELMATEIQRWENDTLREKLEGRERYIAMMQKRMEAHGEQKKDLEDRLETATKKVGILFEDARQKDCSIARMKAEYNGKLHKLQTQSLKSLFGIQTINEELKRKVSKMEGLRVQDAQCMRDLFEERDKSKPKILKEQKRSLKLEADDQQQSTLRRDQPVLTKEEEHLERTPSEQGRNEQLVREKTELQQLVSRIKKKHSEEVEALDEEIEQLKTVAVELGFL